MQITFNTGIVIGVVIGVLISVGLYSLLDMRESLPDTHKNVAYETSMYTMGGMHGDMEHMESMQQMMVTSERDFIEMMIPHHEEAIDTANQVLEHGATTEEIATLMTNIVAAQTAEVVSMREWYEVWFGEAYQDSGKYQAMMRDLSGLSEEEIDRAFLVDMIPHHMGAIMMARSIQPYIEHDEMAVLTENIVRTQSAEIVQMRRLLKDI